MAGLPDLSPPLRNGEGKKTLVSPTAAVGRATGDPGDALAHRGIRLHVPHLVVLHDAEPTVAESGGDGQRHLGFGENDLRPVLLYERLHFLFFGNGGGPALFGLGLGDPQVGGGLIGVELVECLAHHKIPVRFLVREPHFYQAALNKAEAAIVESHLRLRGVDLQTNETVAKVAVSATGQVSGIETLSGKRFACDFLGVTIGVEPAIDWLRNVATPPELGRGIKVDASFQTSLNSIYAAGDCAEISASGAPAFVEQLWYAAKRQGEIAAHAMLGDKPNYNRPIFYNSSKFFEIEFTCAGLSHPGPQGREYFSAVPGRPASVRLIEQNGLFAGISLLGSRWRHELFERWIAERRSVSLVVEHLEQAQFDVEFGRVPMAAVRRDLAAQIQQIQGQLAVA